MKIVSKNMAEGNELQSRFHRTRTPNLNHRHLRIYSWESSYLQVSQNDLPYRLVSMCFNAELQFGVFWGLRILTTLASSFFQSVERGLVYIPWGEISAAS